MVEDRGNVTCFEAGTGNAVWTAKLEGPFSSSPVLAAGHVYVVNEKGVAFVFKAGRHFELVAKSDLGDGGFATPVICGGRIYLRTLHWLYCLGESKLPETLAPHWECLKQLKRILLEKDFSPRQCSRT
jgi:hypothetical protein